MRDPHRVAILISGRGSNMRALVEKARDYEVVLVASNKPAAEGLRWAEERGIATWAAESKGQTREAFDSQVSAALEKHGIGTVALAGFMRILSPWFVEQWRGRMLNIHPSLLPAHRGLDTHRRALEAGDLEHGCTVHFVTTGLDEGPAIATARVPVLPGDTPESLAARVLVEEHRIYPEALAMVCRGEI